MPIFTLNTNVPQSKVTPEFLKSLSQVIGDMLGKPVSYVSVRVNGDCVGMMFGGSSDLCAIGTLTSIGGVGGDVNKSHSDKLFTHITKRLAIAGNRMFIQFVNVNGSDVGWNGDTFG